MERVYVLSMRGDDFTPVPIDGDAEEEGMRTHDRLVSIADAQARLAGITRREVYNRIKAGDLKAKKLGRRVGIYESSIDAYIAGLPEMVVAS